MKNGSFFPRSILISGGLIFGIVAGMQAAMALTGLEFGSAVALGAALLIALILTLAAAPGTR